MENQFQQFFPFGTQYHRAPTPLESEWEGDLKEIAATGYTHVQFRPQWRCHERIRGVYDFSELKRLCDMAHKYHLRVIIKPQLENAPDWVFTELGGSRIGFGGNPLPPIAHAAFYVGGWWPCFDNPAVAKAAEKFTEKLARQFKDHPALWFFNSWNEPRSRPLGQCQCEHSVRSYRDYLRGKFDTVEKLNKAYGKAWTSFDTIFPPQSHSDYTELYLWRQWASESVASHIEYSTAGLRRGAPGKFVMCHVGQCSYTQDPACDTSNDFLNCQKVDWYGCSFSVELLPKNILERHKPLALGAWMYRVDSNYWCQEFYTNYSCWHEEADPEYVEQVLWMALASGCRGLTFWQYRSERIGEESNGWGMREMDGSATPRSERCDKVASLLKSWGADFAKTSPTPRKVAVLFDCATDLLMRIQDMNSRLDRIWDIQENCNYSYKFSTAGSAFILRQCGYAVDFVTPEQDLSDYQLVVASCWEFVRPEAIPALRDYVEKGGTLLVEYPFACRDERTWVTLKRPAYGLESLTGCKEKHRLALKSDRSAMLTFANRQQDEAVFCKTELQVCGGEAIARWEDGKTAAVLNHVGKGVVYTCGGSVSMAIGKRCTMKAIPEIYRQAFSAAGLPISESPFWIQERISETDCYRFVFNQTETEQELLISEGFQLLYVSNGNTVSDARLVLGAHSTAVLWKKNK
ncbi:MAG: hypothetical protein GX946_01145 [Oligosphaeraceae bacterium]|nr:hypothetical protein [Oligosphaeraceae bacterium]